jgi:glycosyltransferase involved in cell wall biosynthesis
MTKVVHIQKSILSTGRAPLRLHNAFLEHGIDSKILSMDFDVNLTDRIKQTSRGSRVIARVDQFFQSVLTRKIDSKYGLYSFLFFGTDISKTELIKQADIIYVHWVQGGFLNLSSYRCLAKLGKPVVIVMHDMWTITGGCHHSFDCKKYTIECSDCPMFSGRQIFNWPLHEFRMKRRMYSEFSNFYFVSPSKWLYSCAKESKLTKDKPVYHIPNILDTRVFKSVDKRFARKVLGLPEEGIIVSFGAFFLSSAYKGWLELSRALQKLKKLWPQENITVLVFGGGFNSKIAEQIPFTTRFMGFLKDEYSTVLIYNSTDVFVTPSLADNFPTTVLESLACGTSVVGFNIGGIPDMIQHKENGYLAEYKNADDLAAGIKYCIENNVKGKLHQDFQASRLIKKHLDLFRDIT